MESEYAHRADLETQLLALAHGVGIIIAALAAGVILGAGAINVFGGIDALVGPDGELVPFANAIATALQFVGFIGVVVGYVLRYDDRSLIGFRRPSLRDVGLVVAGFLALVGLSALLGLVIDTLGLETAQNAAIDQGKDNPVYFLYLIPISLLLVGPGEELVFRGVVQGVFRRAYGPVPAIVVASLLFGAVHVVALVGQGASAIGVYLAIAAILGVVLGTVYEVTGNILVPALIHGIWNALLFLSQWYVATHDIQQELVIVLLPT